MVDVNQYTFNFEEIVTALIKHLNINSGLWTLSVNFRFQAKNIRDERDSKASPGFVGVIDHIGLARATKSIPGLTVDAAKVNPKPKPAQEPHAKLN